MPEKCNFCDKVNSNKSNRARHERDVQADEKGIPVYRCWIFPVTRRQLSESQSHLSTIADLQTFVIIVILLLTTKTCSSNASENNTCYLFLTTQELSTQFCTNMDINNNSNNNEVPSHSRTLEGVSSLVGL